MTRQAISTASAPAAVGPYSQAIVAGDLIFTPVRARSIRRPRRCAAGPSKETERTLRNLAAVLDAAGATFADVVKTTVFLADINDFTAMNAVYARFFPMPPLGRRWRWPPCRRVSRSRSRPSRAGRDAPCRTARRLASRAAHTIRRTDR